MSVVLKYLKHSAFAIILVICLLVAKAGADLLLPLYTSRIVNIGIQQGGLEYAIPQELSAYSFGRLAEAGRDCGTRGTVSLLHPRSCLRHLRLDPSHDLKEEDIVRCLPGRYRKMVRWDPRGKVLRIHQG
jgi:ABC-type multidrug transport system fused ATPase/permease subunit